MNKNRIRLTESQLYRVIEETVKGVLNEIRIGGESLHGNSPEDWTAMEKVRDAYVDKNSRDVMHHGRQSLRDLDNAEDLYRKHASPFITSDNYLKGWQNMRSKGGNKANKISKNLGLREGKKPNDVQHGKHSFKGLRYDRNGNPIYTYDGHPNTETQELLKNQGWKMSPKHGMYGQISDPSKIK